MELNNKTTDGISDWSKKMFSNLSSHYNSNIITVHPISNYKCCDNPKLVSSNDGNKTQICISCNYKHRIDK